MSYPQEFLTALESSEKRCPLPYRDPTGIETIGIGHNLTKPLPNAVIDLLRDCDLDDAAAQVDKALPWTANLDRVRYYTLVELCFNMGIGNAQTGKGLLGFHNMLIAVYNKQWFNAGESLLQSKWRDEVGDTRANRLAEQLKTGQWKTLNEKNPN